MRLLNFEEASNQQLYVLLCNFLALVLFLWQSLIKKHAGWVLALFGEAVGVRYVAGEHITETEVDASVSPDKLRWIFKHKKESKCH